MGRNSNDAVELFNSEYFLFKDAKIRLNIEDPYGLQQNNVRGKNDLAVLPNLIELEFKTKPFSGLVKSVIVSAVAITFAIVISIFSILIYRACVRDQLLNATSSETPLSICQTSEDCKYDMNTRHLEESFFQNPVEPLSAQSHNSRW